MRNQTFLFDGFAPQAFFKINIKSSCQILDEYPPPLNIQDFCCSGGCTNAEVTLEFKGLSIKDHIYFMVYLK